MLCFRFQLNHDLVLELKCASSRGDPYKESLYGLIFETEQGLVATLIFYRQPYPQNMDIDPRNHGLHVDNVAKVTATEIRQLLHDSGAYAYMEWAIEQMLDMIMTEPMPFPSTNNSFHNYSSINPIDMKNSSTINSHSIDPNRVYSVAEAAKLLGRSQRYVRDHVKAGRISAQPGRQRGEAIMIPGRSLLLFLGYDDP